MPEAKIKKDTVGLEMREGKERQGEGQNFKLKGYIFTGLLSLYSPATAIEFQTSSK